ncbi:MFS transporter [Neisseria sp. Ec49-e6-T10]|uniref:MFS transporter n=1 Tax=Neisseria sp. Ec49-e6-T10 TaxID=3140744 RepID=UPI003EC11DCA
MSTEFTQNSAPSNASTLSKPKTIASITIGNGLEFYDFVVYSFFAKMIGELYFPIEDKTGQLLLSFATFGVGFLMRPLGGIIIGLYADKYGRKPAVALTLWLMGLSSLVFVFTPTYAQIGVWAPIMILLARLVQGFAIGGEMGASTAFLMEFADKGSRGFYASWAGFSQGFGSLVAALVGVTLTGILSPEALISYGWRIAFLVGVIIIPVGIFIRRKLPETADVAPSEYNESKALRSLFTEHAYALTACILLMIGLASSTYIIIYYLSNYAMTVLMLAPFYAIMTGVAASLVQVVLSPFSGMLSDKIGHRRLVLLSRIFLLIIAYPCFLVITHYQTIGVVLAMVSILSIPLSVTSPATMVVVTELLPKSIRATGLSISYCVAIAIFGGFAQFFAALLIKWTNNPNAPAFYLIGCGLISLLGLYFARKAKEHEWEK